MPPTEVIMGTLNKSFPTELGADQNALLGRVLRGYCRWQPPDEVVAALRLLGGGILSEDCQQLFMQGCFGHDGAVDCPPPSAYRLSVLKALALAAEQDGCEVDEALSDALVCLLSSPQAADNEAAWGWKTFFYESAAAGSHASSQPLEGRVSLRLSRDMLAGSTGCFQWEAGLLLGQHILSRPELIAGKACVELGCGAGLVGVCLHRAGAARVLLTDGSSAAVNNCRSNVAANCGDDGRLPAGVRVEQLSWDAPVPAGLEPDVVLGADLLYAPDSFPALLRMLAALLRRKHGACGLLACCERDPATLSTFQAQAAAGGLQLEQVEADTRVCFVDALSDVTGRLLLFEVRPVEC